MCHCKVPQADCCLSVDILSHASSQFCSHPVREQSHIVFNPLQPHRWAFLGSHWAGWYPEIEALPVRIPRASLQPMLSLQNYHTPMMIYPHQHLRSWKFASILNFRLYSYNSEQIRFKPKLKKIYPAYLWLYLCVFRQTPVWPSDITWEEN